MVAPSCNASIQFTSRRHVAIAFLVVAALQFSQAAHADLLIGINPATGNNTNVLSIQTSPFSVSTIGTAGARLGGLDFKPGTFDLFASSGHATVNPGSLYKVNMNTGAVSLVGSGTGFKAVPGLAFDYDGKLFGSADTIGGFDTDALISIDPDTGGGSLIGSFGSIGGNTVLGIDALAVDPITKVLYGASGFQFDGSPGDIFNIDKGTGVATLLGTLSEFGTSSELPATLAGLAFSPNGTLFGSLGGVTGGPGDGRIISVDLTSLTFSYLGDAASGSVADIAVNLVPEPGSITLLLIGLGPLLCYASRQRIRAVSAYHARLDDR